MLYTAKTMLLGAGAATAGAVLMLGFASEQADANPYWAQQTGKPCAACHYGGRETEGRAGLNPTGQAFLNCGYHFPSAFGGCGGAAAPAPAPQYQYAPSYQYPPSYQYQYPPTYQQPPAYQASPYYYR